MKSTGTRVVLKDSLTIASCGFALDDIRAFYFIVFCTYDARAKNALAGNTKFTLYDICFQIGEYSKVQYGTDFYVEI